MKGRLVILMLITIACATAAIVMPAAVILRDHHERQQNERETEHHDYLEELRRQCERAWPLSRKQQRDCVEEARGALV